MEINSTLLEWSKKLIACPSVTNGGTRAIVELCARELLAPAGIQAQLIPSIRCGDEQLNLIAVVQGERADVPALVLNTHLDTVAPGDSQLWTACDGDPFKPSLSCGRIYGLGAADTKLDFAAKAFALVETPKPLRRTVYLVATFGEESGLRGARELVESGLLPSQALAFVGEPSNLALITANRGLNVFRLVVEGRGEPLSGAETFRLVSFVGLAAHSSTPHLGRSAIVTALHALVDHPHLKVIELAGGDAVNKVPALCQARIIAGSEIYLPEATLLSDAEPLGEAGRPGNFDTFGRATAWNQVDDPEDAGASRRRESMPAEMLRALLNFVEQLTRCTAEKNHTALDLTNSWSCNAGIIHCTASRSSLEFELRQPPETPAQEIADTVEALVDILKREFPTLKFDLIKIRANPGFSATPMNETVAMATQAMAQVGLKVEIGAKAGCTEAGIYAAAGLKPVVFGPGPSTGVIHAPNEYNLISEVEAAARFYCSLLRL